MFHSRIVLFILFSLFEIQILYCQNLPPSILNCNSKPLTFVLFASENSCRKCYEVIDEEFVQQIDTSKVNFILVLRTLNQLGFKSELKNSQPMFLRADSIIWDYANDFFYKDSILSGIFNTYQINRTPALLILGENREMLYRNSDLFNGFNLNERSKKKILNVICGKKCE